MFTICTQADDAVVVVHANEPIHRITPYLTGACIEDVNHEIYGGLYSQMIFGESFQEESLAAPFKGFTAYGGQWATMEDGVTVNGGDGFKLVANDVVMTNGEVSVEVLFQKSNGANAGLIVNVAKASVGADRFDGYEISLDPSGKLILGAHRQNFELLRQVPCAVPLNQWNQLAVRMTNAALEVLVNGKMVVQFQDSQPALKPGSIGLRVWRQDAQFRQFQWQRGGETQLMRFEHDGNSGSDQVSGMWREFQHGTVAGNCSLETNAPFAGRQSQRVSLLSGQGEIGIENQGLNRQGMAFIEKRPYEGYIWVRAEQPTEFYVALESRDGATVYAEQRLELADGNQWQRLDFFLTPSASDQSGRFAVKLKQPGSVTVGHVFLEPGDWGRFKGLPMRKDVVNGLIDQGVTMLRYGGSMVNHGEYRWKKMVGPRDRRPPYQGLWYAHSSNGWGIPDFLNLCDAAGFLAIPDFNINESPADMVDFIEYANGPADSEWGRRRVADGHPQPYGLKYLELGNEERVDDSYANKFEALAKAIWAKDPTIILVVGDFTYHGRIQDPYHFSGADSGITTLAGQERILKLAKEHQREVWFDVHVWTEGPKLDSSLASTLTYCDALDKIANGAAHKVVIFELNANNHSQGRALANALAINTAERDGRLPIIASANGLQPDGQNDNGWDQGLLFLNPSSVWLQPPGYVSRMIARNYQPLVVKSEVAGAGSNLDVSAKRSDDGKILVLQLVNLSGEQLPVKLHLDGFAPSRPLARVEELVGALDDKNTAQDPERCQTTFKYWPHGLTNGETVYTCPPFSFTVIRFE